jgi:hypothetical protein
MRSEVSLGSCDSNSPSWQAVRGAQLVFLDEVQADEMYSSSPHASQGWHTVFVLFVHAATSKPAASPMAVGWQIRHSLQTASAVTLQAYSSWWVPKGQVRQPTHTRSVELVGADVSYVELSMHGVASMHVSAFVPLANLPSAHTVQTRSDVAVASVSTKVPARQSEMATQAG